MNEKRRGKRQTDTTIEFGRKLRALRMKRGLSQHKLAELAGLDKNWPTEAERGFINPTLETLLKIATALDVDPDVFVTEKSSDS